MTQLASALTGTQGERVALCEVAVSAALQDLLAEVTIAQTYRNDEQTNIEAVYTFPLPLDAVLLDLEVVIGERVLKGVVVEKQDAEAQYEEAIEAGNAAVMLEAIEPGLYTMNVGNLLPHETVSITFRYAILYRWAGDQLRFFLPTTIAPRYGDSPHEPHQTPVSSLTVENKFSLRVDVMGALCNAQFSCPSHKLKLDKSDGRLVLSLSQPRAVMDRDFVLNVKAPQATRDFVQCGQDGDGLTALASFQPFFPGLRQPRPLSLVLVIDCSGSMTGDSIQQAKEAVSSILDRMQPQEEISIVAFGDRTQSLSEAPLACNKTNIAKAKRFAKGLDANLGGTEISTALRTAYRLASRSGTADIFLITDGEVSDWQRIVDDAKATDHRIFTVGVSSAVSEAFVRQLAEATQGACELVSPQEGMADRVVRHFERMRAPRAKRVTMHWPEGARQVNPARIGAVFEGDTIVASACFERAPARGHAILEIETDDGETLRHALPFPEILPTASADGQSTVARVAAAERLNNLEDAEGRQSALRYKLVSRWTNYLVIDQRSDDVRPQALPALRQVPQTLAAGWGGVGRSMRASISAFDCLPSMTQAFRDVDVRFSVRNERSVLLSEVRPTFPPALRTLIDLINSDVDQLNGPSALELLNRCGLAGEFDAVFSLAADLGLNVDRIAEVVLAGILSQKVDSLLSFEAQAALTSLRRRASEVTDALKEMGGLGEALHRRTYECRENGIFHPGGGEDAARRFVLMTKLQDEIKRALNRSKQHLSVEPATHP